MNIVKFKSEKMVGPGSESYNETFRNKYCYALHMNYAVVFEDIDAGRYYELERMDDAELVEELSSLDHGYFDFVSSGPEFYGCVDMDATQRANDISKFIAYNNFTPDTEITLDELKKFRWWLAYTILEIYKDSEDLDIKTKDMLRYYRKNMMDSTVRHLENFSTQATTIQYNTSSRCSCTGGLTSAQLMAGVTSCDPVSVYRRGVYDYMVEKFSNINFWQEFETEFLEEFKRYIDGIIAHNLPLTTSEYLSVLVDCSCLGDSNSTQELLMNILRNLSKSLGYLITDEMSGHKNFIKESFNSWARQLYEKMYWV